MSDLALLVEDIDRHEDHPLLYACQDEIDHLDAVGEVHAEAVTGSQTPVAQELRHAITPGIDVTESELLSAKLEGHIVAAVQKRKIEKVGQVHDS
jgi:hypothetical protein